MDGAFICRSRSLCHLDVPPWGDFNFLRWEPGHAVAAHDHPFLQAIHVLDGHLAVDCGRGWIHMGPGDVHVLPPGFAHHVRTDAGHTQFGLNFASVRDERGILSALLEVFRKPLVIHVPFRERWHVALGAPDARTHGPRRFRLLHALEDYTLALLEHEAGAGPDPQLERLLELLEAHAEERLGVAEIAAELHLSNATLQRLCRRHFGSGAAHVHERVRLQRAADHLLQSDCTVSACAEVSGYADTFHFSKAFKRVFGASPLAYRQQRRRAMR
ncbi:MAG: helix-turn-helix transcriptional regulator [Lentisphaerae bacterium]|jgi:AraC-like DNA-binding protein|nr:helix-turn-helix transcriptional regulator [Lentisphaerota bacterium]MBT5605120.1 helix-turn-helix transcriptional regulator [Lentisphaerota bacterium]MBT7054063.1 helix-turn-helix transcriptional regulator [Lentisphaerota bacterium]MBT7843789.1 helix-turn-helix transcriptional regulator [Lentisphaerota bacterium]